MHHFKSGTTFYKDNINKHLRKLLFLIIQNTIKQQRHEQNHILEYYDKLKMQLYYKYHKAVSIAYVNNLLKLLFQHFTHDIHFYYHLAV